MKKIIALLLMLTLCVGLFAGCTKGGDETTGPASGVSAAKEYLYAMYKDSTGAVSRDFTVVSVVSIDGVRYNVEWTTDAAAEYVTIVPGDTTTSIDINEKPAEEVSFTLTATVKDDSGNSESVSFSYKIPAFEGVSDGAEIVLYNPGDGIYATGIPYVYTSSSGSTKNELETTKDKSQALVLSVKSSGETVSFVTKDGKYLYADGTNVQLVDEEGEYTAFVLESAEGGQFIRCATATYNDKPQYVEIYSGYLTCYSMGTNLSLYIFELQDASTPGAPVEPDPTEPETPTDPEPSEPEATEPTPTEPTPTEPQQPTEGPSTDSELKDGDKITIYNPGDGIYVTGTQYVYTSSSGNTKNELETTSNQSEALVLTVRISGDTVSFVTADGKYLYADGTNVELASEAGEYTAFVLESADGGYYIRCATATYNDKPQYLEIYKGYMTVYGMGSNTALYIFQLNKQ